MDRQVTIQIVDEFLTPEANDDGGDSQIQVLYDRRHQPSAVPDGTPKWRDCLEVMMEGAALTLRDALIDPALCEHAADLMIDHFKARVQELLVEIPGMDSRPHSHIPGVTNLH